MSDAVIYLSWAIVIAVFGWFLLGCLRHWLWKTIAKLNAKRFDELQAYRAEHLDPLVARIREMPHDEAEEVRRQVREWMDMCDEHADQAMAHINSWRLWP